MIIFQFEIGDPGIFGELKILMDEGEPDDWDWSRLDDDDDDDAVQDLAPIHYWPTIFYNNKNVGQHDESPFDSLEQAYNAAIELVEEHCDILLGIYEEQGVEVKKFKKTGQYLETRRIVKELQNRISVERERSKRQATQGAASRLQRALDSTRPERSRAKRPHRGDSKIQTTTAHESKRRLAVPKSETVNHLRQAGLPESETNISVWANLTATEIVDAIDRGFPNSILYLQLKDVFTDYDESLRYNPDALGFLKVGVSRSVAEWLARSSRVQPATAARWIREGLPEEMLVDWLKDDPDWATDARGVAETMTWAALGFDPNQRSKWFESGLQLTDAEELIDNKFTVAVAFRWMSAGFTPGEARKWIVCGFRNVKVATDWRQFFDPDEAKSWKAIGVKSAAEALEWSKLFDAARAAPWVEVGLSPKVAARRRSAGLSPHQR